MPEHGWHPDVATRRRTLLLWMSTLGILVLTPTALRAREDRLTAKQGFVRIQAVVTPATGDALAPYFPTPLVERRLRGDTARIGAWRTTYHGRLSGARMLDVREKDDRALVRCVRGNSTDEILVPLRRDGSRWVVDAPREYTVKGDVLKSANGRKPARIRLTARTTNTAYGTSAFSFAYVTNDPELCSNRMDVWYCHNGDLHVSGDGSAADVGKTSLRRANSVPLDTEWCTTLKPERGHVYVLRSKREGDRDFYVRFRVESVKPDVIRLDWEILAMGEGSPPSIHEPSPLKSNDGADGYDGLCGKNR